MDDIPEATASPFIEIKLRCQGTKIEIEPQDINEETKRIKIKFPAGRNNLEIPILNIRLAKLFLQTPFENIHGIKGYNAIFSYQDKFIEAELDTVGVRFLPREIIFGRLSQLIATPFSESLTNRRIVCTGSKKLDTITHDLSQFMAD